jgi:serine/threonine protein kinase
MDARTWQTVKEWLADARELPEPERASFIAQRCPDEELRSEVLKMLASDSSLSGIVNAPTLASGTRLGSYQIDTVIGTGGMGEVYRARDTKLGRDVALKVLPAIFENDRDRIARLEREATLLASLNQSNIAHIYGLEESNGTRALVMELVEGETLADRILRGAIPLKEALPIARQICEALEAAHEHGIIHRDLKPANIKVRSDGTVKVLDFGLAKAIDPSDPGGIQNSPTMTATGRGVILGTAAYMSPEQAAGSAIDKRSDIWALGVVLLEMLTGTCAFAGDTVSHVLASVIKDQPDFSRLPSDTPASIRRLLRRCLEKDRKHRLADAADVRLEIEDALTSPAEPRVPAPSRRLTFVLLSVIAAILIVVLLGVLATIRQRGVSDAPLPLMRVEISTPTIPTAFALSPDGRYLAFVGTSGGPQRLWLRPLGTTEASPLPGTEDADSAFWSPNSRSIGFFAGGKLRRVDIDGAPPRDITDAAAYGASWDADGTILFTPTINSPLSRVSASGGQPVAVTRLDPPRQMTHRYPHFLPDGRHFLFVVGGTQQGLYLGLLAMVTSLSDFPRTNGPVNICHQVSSSLSARARWLRRG